MHLTSPGSTARSELPGHGCSILGPGNWHPASQRLGAGTQGPQGTPSQASFGKTLYRCRRGHRFGPQAGRSSIHRDTFPALLYCCYILPRYPGRQTRGRQPASSLRAVTWSCRSNGGLCFRPLRTTLPVACATGAPSCRERALRLCFCVLKCSAVVSLFLRSRACLLLDM